MKLMTCPINGPRSISEFAYGGEMREMPDPAAVSDEAWADYVFNRVDPEFVARAKAKKGGFIVGGSNYGQGSSREHAAIAPMYLGIVGVIVKDFARIHLASLSRRKPTTAITTRSQPWRLTRTFETPATRRLYRTGTSMMGSSRRAAPKRRSKSPNGSKSPKCLRPALILS